MPIPELTPWFTGSSINNLWVPSLLVQAMPHPFIIVLDPSKGVCADPVEGVAILEVKGPGPPGGVSERQLSPDRGGEKT
jgi:hypothetical protein